MSKTVVHEYEIFEAITDYFKPLNKKEAKEYLLKLYKDNSRRFRNVYLKTFFKCLLRGIDEEAVVLVICTSNIFRGFLKKMVSNILLPFSGFEAVSKIIISMRDEINALHMGGYFDPNENVVFAVVENPFKEIKNNEIELVYILHHELCHYTASNHNKEFKSLFKDKYLIPYYTELFKLMYTKVLGIDDYDIDTCKKAANVLIDNLLERENYKNVKNTSKYDEKQYIMSCYNDLINVDPYIANTWANLVVDSFTVEKKADTTYYITSQAYKNNSWELPRLFKHYQELLFPSEVIAVLAYILRQEKEFIDMLDLLFR